MALIDELKEQREQSHKLMHEHQRNAFEWQINADIEAQRTRDLDRAIAALEAPAQPLAELRSVTPATEEESGDHIDDDTIKAICTETCIACGGEIRLDVSDAERDPDMGLGEDGWQCGDCTRRYAAPAPLIDAQTCEAVDPRCSWKAEPEIPEGFVRWEGERSWPFTPEQDDDEGSLRVTVIYADGLAQDGAAMSFVWEHDSEDRAQHIIAYRIIEAPAAEQEASVEIEQESDIQYLNKPEPGPYDAAVEKGAITQDEADFLISERERIAADEQAKFFAEGMMADADRHQSDQRSIVEKIGGLFKREREDA